LQDYTGDCPKRLQRLRRTGIIRRLVNLSELLRSMRRSDFDYVLPEALIAQYPPEQRGSSRLLCVEHDVLRDGHIADFPAQLHEGDLLVLNDTRVIPARLHGVKSSGGRVEILIERLTGSHTALAHLRASKPLRPGGVVEVNGAALVMIGREGDLFALRLERGAASMQALLDAKGEVPLPPYIAHKPDAVDAERYQTVYARHPGAVAAPTAGLHFDDALLAKIQERGVEIGFVTLHVGAGTFQPLREDEIARHHMHAEQSRIAPELAAQVRAARDRGGHIVAVGTTVVRALESALDENGEVCAFNGDTRLFITPGYEFRAVDALLTNFHLPESTLLMLVCAFAGHARVMAAYRHAVAQHYRFFSYGDAMWLPSRLDD